MSHYIEVANTSAITTVRNLRLKVNEVIGVVNQIGQDEHSAAGNSYLTSTYVSNTTFQAFVANTNAYIAATSGTGEVSNAAFQSFIANTNLAIANRLQVANAATIYQTKTVERAALANTNAYIATKASWASVTNTNTALRLLISDRLQVANADNKYATKAYAAANSYVKLLLANTNAYIAEVQASITAANEVAQDTIDYGFITSSVDLDTSRDYGTL